MSGSGNGSFHRGLGKVSGTKVVAVASASAGLENLALNPGFEKLLPGSHGDASKKAGNMQDADTSVDVNTGTDVVTITTHEFTTADEVRLETNGTLPAPLLVATQYFVRAIDADNIAFYPTSGDASADTNRIDITTTGSGTIFVGLFSTTPKNSPMAAWQMYPNGALGDMELDISGVSDPSGNSLFAPQITTNADFFNGATTPLILRQVWGDVVDGVNQYLLERVARLRTKTVIFAADIDGPSASSVRLQIEQDGSGTAQAKSVYHTGAGGFERLVVALEIPDDADEVKFNILFELGAEDVVIDNVAISPADSALSSLPYVVRNELRLVSPRIGDASADISLTGTTSKIQTGSGTPSPDVDINAARPAWATGVEFILALALGSVEYSRLFTAGATNFYHEMLDSAGKVKQTFELPLGSNGQFEIQNEANGVAADIFLRRWVGDDL